MLNGKAGKVYKQPFSFYFIEISAPSSSRLFRLHAYLIFSNVPTALVPTAFGKLYFAEQAT